MAQSTVLLAAALVFAAVVDSFGGGAKGLLKLERIHSPESRFELEALRDRDRVRHARLLQQQQSFYSRGIVDFPVGGNADPYASGIYYTKVRLGSPPREFHVQIDTGSDILWVTCSSCTDCPQNSGISVPLTSFDAATSSTVGSISCSDDICASIVQTASAECSAESNQCGYTFQYGDGSGTAGFYMTDMLSFDTVLGNSVLANSSARIIFGCSTALFGDLAKSDKAVDGIIGFGRYGLSVISQLSSHGITPKVFSHCLRGGNNGGGVLVLGEILDPRIVYTPLVPSLPHYNLYLQSISVSGQLLPIEESVFTTSGSQGTIVDSGTTLAYLVESAYDPFVAAITAVVPPSVKPITSRGSQCYLVSTSIAETFPLASFNFLGGASMILRPADYLLHMGFVDGAALWCMGFNKVLNQRATILGDLVLKDKIFVYDLAHQRIGWADYDCSLSVNVSVTSSKDFLENAGELPRSSSSSRVGDSSFCRLLILVWCYIYWFWTSGVNWCSE